MYRVVASERDTEWADGFDELWTISSEDYTPRNNSDSSDMGDDRELHLHQEERLEVHQFQWIATWEYGHFNLVDRKRWSPRTL